MAPMVLALAVSRSRSPISLKVQHGRACGKNTPVHRIGESLLLRKAEAGARRRKLRRLLAVSQGGQGKGAKNCCGVRARLQRRVWLLVS